MHPGELEVKCGITNLQRERDPVERGAMKLVERIFEHRIRQQIDIDDMQLCIYER